MTLVKSVQELNQQNQTLEDLVRIQQQTINTLTKQTEQLLQRIENLESK